MQFGSLSARARSACALLTTGAILLLTNPGISAAQTPPRIGPPGDAFYVPPSPLPLGAPGDVIWYRPTQLYLDPARLFPFRAKAWKVLYLSQSLTGRPLPVSGTVIVPNAPYSGTRPLLTYAVGTHGMGDQCAPSKRLPAGTDAEAVFLKAAVDRGWAVAITDYVGLGTPGTHPYVVSALAGRAVLDIARAASRIPNSGVSSTALVGIMGYSEGGNAAAAAAEISPSYAPELQVVGAAAGGVPADLGRVAENIDGGPFFGYLAFAALGFDAAYPELQLATYLNSMGTSLFAQANRDCSTERYAFLSIDDLTTTNPLQTAAWPRRIEENRLG